MPSIALRLATASLTLSLMAACEAGSPRPMEQRAAKQSTIAVRSLVIELGPGGPRVLSQQNLARPWREPRAPRPAQRGGFAVLDASGRELATGRFRLPRGIHALFNPPDTPAQAVHVPVSSQVIWLRVPLPRGATRLRLRDRHKGNALGELPL